MNENKIYENVISLGYFCNVALEIERIGLRKASYPFDWIITSDFNMVIQLIKSEFKSFMLYDNLYQEYAINPDYYFDIENTIHFYHDFSSKISLKDQFKNVKNKYGRRINRFFKDIKKPTLFVRYITNKKEFEFINENYAEIDSLLKSFNKANTIIYITNEKNFAENNNVKTFYTEKDKKESVSRKFLNSSPDIKKFLLGTVDISKNDYKKNIKRAKHKFIRRKINSAKKKILSLVKNIFRINDKNTYRHNKQYQL